MIKPTSQHEGNGLRDPSLPTMITAAERNMKASKVILYATSALLVLIWMSAFIISYVSLVAVATVGGLTYPWVWLWPLLLDAFMCIGSLDVIRRELNGETTTIAWAVVIGVTLVSTGFNITLADPSVLSWATHALAPVVCFLAFEIEMGVLRSHFRQHDNGSKMSEPNKNVKPDVNVVVGDVNVARENVRNNVKVCKPEMSGIKETKQDIQNRIQNYYTQHPDAGYAEAGKALGISRQVVRMNVLKMSQPAAGEV